MSRAAISDLRDEPHFADAVAERIWRAFWQKDGHPLELLKRLVQHNLEEGPIPTALVAHEGERFLGTVSIIANDEESRPQYTPWIAALWVEPEHREQGIGALLVERGVEFAFRTGARRVYLLSGPQRRPFYENRGWSVVEVLEDGMFVLAQDADGMSAA
jgi:predicted N-acetyltransferase YhbS